MLSINFLFSLKMKLGINYIKSKIFAHVLFKGLII